MAMNNLPSRADKMEAWHSIAVREECCQAWARAHVGGTDYDEFYALLRYRPKKGAGAPVIGWNLPPIAFCPWCAARKTAKRPE
jgi:hypothetical protein